MSWYRMGKKGFVFTLDALLAVIVLLMAAGTYSALAPQLETSSSSYLLEKKQADDLLAVLDRTGELQSQNFTRMADAISSIVTSSTAWNLTVDYYAYSAGGGFSLNSTNSTGEAYSQAKSFAVSDRVFVYVANDSVSRYGVARMVIWPG